MLSILDLPQNVLLVILQLCKVKDLMALSTTCSLLYHLIKDQLLWKKLCFRDFHVYPEACEKASYETVYKNFLHRYGYMLGLYQSQIGPYGGLLEIRFKAGLIEGVLWEPNADLMEPLKESTAFSIDGSKVPAKCLCIPSIFPHECSLNIDKRNGTIMQCCSDYKKHIQALRDANHEGTGYSMKLIFLNDVLGSGLIHRPMILPLPNDIPSELKRMDGSFPRQIITPGLFKGTYSSHGIEILLFKYKDEHEMHGLKVTGDDNVPASKISVKILLGYPADAPLNDKNTISDLSAIEPRSRQVPLDQIPEQAFSVPAGCHVDPGIQIPSRCIARYHGYGQIAYDGFQHPSYIPTQVIIFNNDLLGVIWMKLSAFSVFTRVDQTFTSNIIKTGESYL